MNAPTSFAIAVAIIVAASASSKDAAAQVTGLSALHRSGQTFIVWNETADPAARYRVYRSTAPINDLASLAAATFIGEVDSTSSENLRVTQLNLGIPNFFRIEDLGTPLSASQGLFVHTVSANESAFYAVTTLNGTIEITTIIPGSNALTAPVVEVAAMPQPVLQRVQGVSRDYAHWTSNVDTPFAQAMWNQPGRAFNFRVNYDSAVAPGTPRPFLVQFHARGGNFRFNANPAHPDAVILCPDDWIGQAPDNTFWYGINEAFPDTTQYTSHLNIDYTVRRVKAEFDWVMSAFPTDADRVYATGGSMGGIGSIFFSFRYPDLFAAIHIVIPKFDFSCSANQCWVEPANGDRLWGTVEDNILCTDGIGIYDRLNIIKQLEIDPHTDRPYVTAWNGRQDTVVGWPEKPPTYAAFQSARQAGVFFWDDRTHNGTDSSWGQVMGLRFEEMWNHRVNKAVAVLTNLSIDDDPGDGQPSVGDVIGTQNGYASWDVTGLLDFAGFHAVRCELRQTGGLDNAPATTASVDWTPRRLQNFVIHPGAAYRFRNIQTGAGVIENRIVFADNNGRLTIEGAVVTAASNIFRIEPFAAGHGDMNCDGLLNAIDVAPFVQALLDPAAYSAAQSNCDITLADFNGDGLVDGGDIDPFVNLLLGGM